MINLRGALAFLAVVAVVGCARQSDEQNLFRKLSSLAATGSPEAQYHLGMLYNNGVGTAQNAQSAFEWFEKSALAGEPLASYKVGCYYAGQFPGVVPLDPGKALEWKLVAAGAGYSVAQYEVAIAYRESGNLEEAARWWEEAASQGHVSALLMLAAAYHGGAGVPMDAEKAYESLLIASRAMSAEQAQAAQPTLTQWGASIDSARAEQMREVAAVWNPQPTALTIRAAMGIDDALRVAR
jgi:TPR repeat protein